MQSNRDVRQTLRLDRRLPQPALSTGVGEDVPSFGGSDIGRNRDDGNARDQAADDGEHGRWSGRRQHCHPRSAPDAFGHRGRGPDQVTSAQYGPVDRHGIGKVVSGRDRRGVQRVQQHTGEATLAGVNPIECVASREVYRNPWLTLREDDVRRQDGSTGIYGVIDKPSYALVIARDDDRFCLVEQFRYPIGLRRWEFPQGTAPGRAGEEPEPADLARRELREETGLRAGSVVLLGLLDVAPGMSSQRGRVFLATDLTEGEHDRELEEQDMRSAWFTGGQIDAMILDSTITDAQSIAAWMLLRLANL